MSKIPNLLKTIGATQIDALVEGMTVGANGYFLTAEQIFAIEENLAGQATVVEAANNATAAAVTAQQNAEAALATANETIAAHVATIATRDARIAELEAEGGDITQTTRENDDKIELGYHDDPNNPFNKIADSLFGAPAKK